jgi:hypothetical protein
VLPAIDPYPEKERSSLLVIVLVVVLVLENRFLPSAFFCPRANSLRSLKDRRIESSVKNRRYGKTLFEDEDDYEGDCGLRMRTQQQHIHPDRENKNHTNEGVALKKSAVDSGQVEIGRSSVLIEQCTAYRQQRKIINPAQISH